MIIDTDTLIRFFTHDDEEKAQRVTEYLRVHKGLMLTDVTFAEVYWTLSSFYQYPKKKIIKGFRMLLDSRWFVCNEALLQNTLDILEKHNISFIDAYTAAYSQTYNDNTILSYDSGFEKVSTIKRIEP